MRATTRQRNYPTFILPTGFAHLTRLRGLWRSRTLRSWLRIVPILLSLSWGRAVCSSNSSHRVLKRSTPAMQENAADGGFSEVRFYLPVSRRWLRRRAAGRGRLHRLPVLGYRLAHPPTGWFDTLRPIRRRTA